MWGLLAAIVWGVVMGGLGTLGAVLTYAKRHPRFLSRPPSNTGLISTAPPTLPNPPRSRDRKETGPPWKRTLTGICSTRTAAPRHCGAPRASERR